MPERVIPNVVPSRVYMPGERMTAEIPIDDDVTQYSFTLDRAGWIPTGRDIVRVRLELWLNRRWQKAGGFSTSGGSKVHRFGHTLFFSGCHFKLPKSPGRKLRVHFEIFDPCRIKADLDLLVR